MTKETVSIKEGTLSIKVGISTIFHLYGRSFVVRTDHSSLKHWIQMDKSDGQEIHDWIGLLQEHNSEVQYRPGAQLHRMGM